MAEEQNLNTKSGRASFYWERHLWQAVFVVAIGIAISISWVVRSISWDLHIQARTPEFGDVLVEYCLFLLVITWVWYYLNPLFALTIALVSIGLQIGFDLGAINEMWLIRDDFVLGGLAIVMALVAGVFGGLSKKVEKPDRSRGWKRWTPSVYWHEPAKNLSESTTNRWIKRIFAISLLGSFGLYCFFMIDGKLSKLEFARTLDRKDWKEATRGISITGKVIRKLELEEMPENMGSGDSLIVTVDGELEEWVITDSDSPEIGLEEWFDKFFDRLDKFELWKWPESGDIVALTKREGEAVLFCQRRVGRFSGISCVSVFGVAVNQESPDQRIFLRESEQIRRLVRIRILPNSSSVWRSPGVDKDIELKKRGKLSRKKETL